MALAVLLALMGSVVVGVWAWAHSDAGGRFIRDRALSATQEALAGKLEVGTVALDGQGLTLRDLKLYTPEGELVAELAWVTAQVKVTALLNRTVRFRSVTFEAPKLHLVHDERGLNLTRALAVKTAAASVTQPSPTFTIEIDELTVRHGEVSFDADDQHVALGALTAQGRARVKTTPLQVDSVLTVSATVSRPLEAPLLISVSTWGSTVGPGIDGAVGLSLGESHLEVNGRWPSWSVEVKNTLLRSETIKHFVPSWPLQPDLVLSARLSEGVGVVHIEAGHSKVDGTLSWASDLGSVSAFSFEATGIDPAELLGRGTASNLELSARGAISDVKSLSFELDLEGRWLSLKRSLATLSAQLKANEGQYALPRLSVIMPGISLSAHGQGSAKAQSVLGVLDVSDLSKLNALAREFTGTELPPLGGHGKLNLSSGGRLTHPALSLTGTLAGLRIANVSMQTLDVDLQVPDLGRPFDSGGVVTAKHLVFDDTVLDEVKATLTTHRRHIEAALSTKGLGDLLLRATARLEPDEQGLALDVLELRSAEGVWSLEAPSHVSWSPWLVLQPVKLHSGTQRIEVAGFKKGRLIEASLNIEALDLAKLPRALAPEKLKLQGLVTTKATVKGHWPRPQLQAAVKVQRFAAMELEGLELEADATLRERRVVGQLWAKTPLGNAKGTVDFDLEALKYERPEPLSAHLELSDVDLTRLAKLMQRELPFSAQVSARVDVDGTAAAPQVKLTIESPELTVHTSKPLVLTHVALEVRSEESGQLKATFNAQGLEGHAHLLLGTPLTLASLRNELPTIAMLKNTPLTAELELQNISVEALNAAGLGGGAKSGRLALQGTLSGTIEAPRAAVTMTARQLVALPFKQLEGQATLTSTELATALTASFTEQSRPLVTLEGSVAAPLAKLRHIDTLGPEVVKLVATLYPLELKTVAPTDSTVSGVAGATLTLEGTLAAPRYTLLGSIGRLAFAKAAMGSARFEVTGEATQTVGDLTIGGLGRDDLKVHGVVKAQLGLAALRAGLAPQKWPIDVSLKAQNFDVGFFSGVTAAIRTLGGQLTMAATVQGTLGSPVFNGEAKWVNGTLNAAGYGNYRDIDFEARAGNSFISVSKLKANSGAGWASFSGEATRAGDVWQLTAEGQSETFPIIVDDQPVAIASLKFDLDGDLAPSFLNIRKLSMGKAVIELPDVRRKNLQNLDRPSDVTIVRGASNAGDLAQRAHELERKKQAKRAERTFAARVVIDAPRHVQVKSSDLDLELGLSDGFRLDYAHSAQLYGEASVLRGKLSVIGREFVVQPGSQVRFAGPATQPYINVTAVYTNNKSDDQTKVTVSVVGRGTDVALKVSSEPALSESEIYTLLATGRPALSRGGGSSVTATQAASFIGSALAAQAKTLIAKNVPIDVLDFESGENFTGVKFSVGKYLTDKIFVGYSLSPGADQAKGQNQHTVRLEYQMTRSMSLEASAGTAPAADANLMWTRDF